MGSCLPLHLINKLKFVPARVNSLWYASSQTSQLYPSQLKWFRASSLHQKRQREREERGEEGREKRGGVERRGVERREGDERRQEKRGGVRRGGE